MSFFTQKQAIETKSSSLKGKRNRHSKSDDYNPTAIRICRIEELEKREYLAADPISVGVVYAEQYVENLGDKFYVAWVGGEDGCTTLDTLVINLDKNQNGALDEGEAYFDTAGNGEVYSYVPFTLVGKSEHIDYEYEVEDGGMVLTISFTNFYAGDSFVFTIDLDEYQPSSTNNAQVEGAEMGGSLVNNLDGSIVSATFTSTHYQTEVWQGMFVDNFDVEYERAPALDAAYSRSLLPQDLDDNNEGISQAGVYDKFDLTPKPIVISGYVYADYDVDCEYDRGEDMPLAGVEVVLHNEAKQVVGTTVTDVNGFYIFNSANLLPGIYTVVSQSDIVSPEGLQYADFCASGGAFGEKITPLEIKVSDMQGGDVAPDNNFAKVLPGSISGYVFEDRNNGEGKNEGEGWDGINYPAKIQLWRLTDSAPVLMETQTVDENGYYEFVLDCAYNEAGTARKLPGRTYELRQIFESDDYVDGKDYQGSLGGQVGDDVISEIFVGYDQHGVHYDFGELKLGSIAGNVYEDRNDNGMIEPGEAGIAGVTVQLYQWDGAKYVWIRETKTKDDGSYQFDDLDIIHNYAIKEIQPSEYSDGKDAVGSLGGQKSEDYFYDVKVGWDQHGYDYNFGELKLGSIEGNVFEDRNDNGVFDENENGIENVTIELYRWNGADYEFIRSTQTDENGAYCFDDLDIAQQYAVRERQPEAYSDGKDHVGSLGGQNIVNDEIRSIDVQWDDHGVKYDFGELKLGSVSGYVYHDSNDNGAFEENEAPIAGVTVELYRLNDGKYEYVSKTTTNLEGFYKFDNLDINQTYAIKEIQPADWNDGKDSVGSLGGNLADNDFIDSVRVLWNQHGENYNFGELLPVGSLSGYVYEDNNDNGVKETGEAGIPDVLIQLYSVGQDGRATLVDSQRTDENGFYEFTNLTPRLTYILKETQPTEYFDGKEAIGSILGEVVGNQVNNDEIVDILLPNNGVGVHYDFGELKPASISGYVYEDFNDNGIKETGEAGIPNTTITLWVLNEETGEYEKTERTALTDSKGYYVFDKLEPGKIYRLVETQPAGYNDGKDTIGSLGGEKLNDDFFKISVKPGDVGVDYNFGELKPQTIPENKPDIPDAGAPQRSVHVPSNLWGAAPTAFPYTFIQPVIPGSMTTLYGGGGGFTEQYSWRLSTINDAFPKNAKVAESTYGFRKDAPSKSQLLAYVGLGDVSLETVSTSPQRKPVDLPAGQWILRELDDNAPQTKYTFGLRGAKAVVGDWAANGKDYIGIFVDGKWLLDRNGDGTWDVYDVIAEMGMERNSSKDQPVTGDWDGDGKTDIGVFGPRWEEDPYLIDVEQGLPSDEKTYVNVSYDNAKSSENMATKENELRMPYLSSRIVYRHGMNEARYDIIDHVFRYGGEGDIAITGDWNGDGITEIGVYRNGEWYLDRNGNGVLDDGDEILKGVVGDDYLPVVGDFDGDGVDTIGYFANGTWYLDVNGDHNLQVFHLGQAGDQPVVGDWDGDGKDEIGVYREIEVADSQDGNLENEYSYQAPSYSAQYPY